MFACIKTWERTELDQKSKHWTILRAYSKHISYLSSEYVCDVTTSWTWSEEICVVMIFPFVETFCWKKYFGEKSSEEIVRKLFCQSYLQNEEKENLQKCCKQKELEKIGASVAAWFLSNLCTKKCPAWPSATLGFSKPEGLWSRSKLNFKLISHWKNCSDSPNIICDTKYVSCVSHEIIHLITLQLIYKIGKMLNQEIPSL